MTAYDSMNVALPPYKNSDGHRFWERYPGRIESNKQKRMCMYMDGRKLIEYEVATMATLRIGGSNDCRRPVSP